MIALSQNGMSYSSAPNQQTIKKYLLIPYWVFSLMLGCLEDAEKIKLDIPWTYECMIYLDGKDVVWLNTWRKGVTHNHSYSSTTCTNYCHFLTCPLHLLRSYSQRCGRSPQLLNLFLIFHVWSIDKSYGFYPKISPIVSTHLWCLLLSSCWGHHLYSPGSLISDSLTSSHALCQSILHNEPEWAF